MDRLDCFDADKIAIQQRNYRPVTFGLQREFFGIVDGTMPDRHGWFTKVQVAESAKQPVGV